MPSPLRTGSAATSPLMIDSITSGWTAGSSAPTSKVPPASRRPSSIWVATGATLPRRQPRHGRRLVRGEAARMRRQPDPADLDQPDAAGQPLLELPPPLQAGPLQVHQRFRVAPLMRFGDQQARCSSGGPGSEAAGLDQQHRPEPGLVAGCRRGDPHDPAAPYQDVRARIRNDSVTAAERGSLHPGELITPDGAFDSHEPTPRLPR